MRIALLLLGSAAFLCLGVAGAHATEAESRLIATFTAVCLQHLGNPAAQSDAAVSAPWNFIQDGSATEEGISPYRSGSDRLGIGESLVSCTLTSEMGSDVTLASVQSAMTAAIGTDEGQPLAEADSRYWLIAGDGGEEHVLALKVSNASGRTLATLWVQRRAALSPRNS
jgi:hypothetical protein